MKSLYLLFAALFVLALQASAQSSFQNVYLGGMVGLNSGDMFQGYGVYGKKKANPSFNFQLGCRLTSVVEFGATFGVSTADLEIAKAFRRSAVPGPAPAEMVRINGTRTVVGIRALFHYLKSEDEELYSGFRLGGTFIRRETNTGHYDYDLPSTKLLLPDYHAEFKPESNRLSVQLVLIGYRYFPWQHVGLGVELAIGAPHYAAFQVCYRIPFSSAVN